MAIVGRVKEIWRFPVKSMGGERLERAAVGHLGIAADRGWAVRDERAGEVRGAKKLFPLLTCRARYVAEPAGDLIPVAEIVFPDGACARTDDPSATGRLSDLLGRPVTLWPRQPATDVDFYRRGPWDSDDVGGEVRAMFGRTEDEPVPDLSIFPPELLRYTSPLGTFFDGFPLHLLTTASLAALREINPGGDFDVRRFRPNFMIDTGGGLGGLVEFDWVGKTLRVGQARAHIVMRAVRCVMPTLAQHDLKRDASVLRTVVRHAGQDLGVYAIVEAPGEVAVGDTVELT